ncbi:hypothetical protein RO3G_14231 [Rhizopus delemar RA 99-880]|uniref:Actin cytoskeleton-regulatory complex protein PAN1 n=3 Tax=Rhizopus TaxID=4842 RepID=I1CM40_RHIO9|nr:hypothetical protein RO3G_14231 [Rhizopus delemar RA 99-880]|eukprot:EIE89520.1 hypothetical protein RO3G_14231 [Rhizopus delemar RA 99-880]
MTGIEIPATLPEEVRREVRNAVLAVRNNNQNLVLQQQQPTGVTSYTSLPNINTQHTELPTNHAGSLQMPLRTGLPQAAMPTGMLGNNMDFASRMMPQTSTYREPPQFQSLSSGIKIPWAVTAEEKKQYTKVFKAWDPENKGTISGDTAKEIFSQSGLPQNVLMQIWNLSDPNNQGRLNVDEFAVAMHLIYRKLNGYNVPETLPPELVPPSTRDLNESVSKLKQTILDDIAKKRYLSNFSSSPSLSPPISQYKSRSTSPSRTTSNKKKDNDDSADVEVGYVSSARRMGPDRTRNRDKSPGAVVVNSSYGYRGKTTRIFDLRKEIEESKKTLQTLEQESVPKTATPYNDLSALDKKSIDSLKEKIKELQIEISKSGNEHGHDAWGVYIQKTAELASVAEEEKSLAAEVEYMLDVTLNGLLAQVNETENDLMDKKIQSVTQRAAKSTNGGAPNLPLDIVGTGPNGEITESDRIRAKAKAMVAARMGKLTGKSTDTANTKAEIDKIKEEREEFRLYTDSIQDNLREIQETMKAIRLEMSMIGLDIRKQDQDQKKIEERGRFEYGESVAKDLKEFILELSYDAALAKAPEVDPSFESRFPVF